MKRIHIWIIVTISLVISPYVAHKVHANCSHENHQHVDRQVINCAYSRTDLQRILAENKERYAKNYEDQTCFYCGCPIDEHDNHHLAQ
jgi:hypothetical protein